MYIFSNVLSKERPSRPSAVTKPYHSAESIYCIKKCLYGYSYSLGPPNNLGDGIFTSGPFPESLNCPQNRTQNSPMHIYMHKRAWEILQRTSCFLETSADVSQTDLSLEKKSLGIEKTISLTQKPTTRKSKTNRDPAKITAQAHAIRHYLSFSIQNMQ